MAFTVLIRNYTLEIGEIDVWAFEMRPGLCFFGGGALHAYGAWVVFWAGEKAHCLCTYHAYI